LLCPDNKKIYVTNIESGRLSVIQMGSIETQKQVIKVGYSPKEIKIHPGGNRAYIVQNNEGIILDLTSNQVTGSFPLAGTTPNGIEFTEDGSEYFISFYHSNKVVRYSTVSNTIIDIYELPGHPMDAELLPGSNHLYIPIDKPPVTLVIDTSSGDTLHSIKNGTHPQSVSFSPDGSLAFIPNAGTGNVSVIETNSNQLIHSVKVGDSPLRAEFSPDGDLCYILNVGSNNVSVINLDTMEVITTFSTKDYPNSILVVPISNNISLVNEPVSEGPSAALYKTFQTDESVWGLTWSADNNFLSIQKYSGYLTVWAVPWNNTWGPIADDGTMIRARSGVWSPNGELFAVRTNWDFYVMDEMGGETYFYYDPGEFVLKMEWAPDSSAIAVLLANDQIIILDTLSLQIEYLIDEFENVDYISWSPDGQYLAIQGNMALNIWDVDIKERVKVYDILLSPTWSADSQFIAGHFWSNLAVQNVLTGEKYSVSAPDYSGFGPPQIDWSPDGLFIATAHEDGTVRLWNADDLSLFTVLDEPEAEVISVAFSPDSQYLAAGDESGKVIIWDVDN